jgi:hypothetical protein
MSQPDAQKTSPPSPDTDREASSCTHPKDEGTRSFSPFAGCSIFIIAGLIALAMVSFLIWSYFQTKEMVQGFTEEQPKTIQVESTTHQESAQVALKSKLVGFRHNIEAQHQDKMTLNAREMNLAIATFDILTPHRGALHIDKIENNSILATISFPTRWEMRSDAKRYINATITILPELVDGAVFPKITAIQTDKGAEVPEEFKKFIAETLLQPLYKDKELGPTFKRLSAVSIQDNTLVLQTDPAYKAPETSPDDSSSDTTFIIDRLLKGFAVIAVVFLALVSIIITLARRKKSSN